MLIMFIHYVHNLLDLNSKLDLLGQLKPHYYLVVLSWANCLKTHF